MHDETIYWTAIRGNCLYILHSSEPHYNPNKSQKKIEFLYGCDWDGALCELNISFFAEKAFTGRFFG